MKGGGEDYLALLSDHKFGGAAADVDGEGGFGEDGEELEDAEVDEAGFFLAGDDFDVKP